MQDAAAFEAQPTGRERRLSVRALARACAPSLRRCALAAVSALLLVLSFPDFELWPLAWVGLVPLMLAIVQGPARTAHAFVLGWLAGTLFFYGSCWWLTHSMINYGGLPAWLAFALIFPGALILGLFPAAWALLLARAAARRGAVALALAPFAWAVLEWARLAATGQLWNAAGYSQAFQPALIQSATWGGVYAVGFLILTVNAAVAYALSQRTARAALHSALALGTVALVVALSGVGALTHTSAGDTHSSEVAAVVVAVQPNVSPNFERSVEENEALVARHLSMSADALREWDAKSGRLRVPSQSPQAGAPAATENSESEPTPRRTPRVVIWPESPMNFAYARDAQFRETVARFAREHHASVLFNSLEPAPAGGAYNSAVLVNERGELVAQYDKIRLLPFGEYVPLPRWLGGGMVSALVGDFTPGARYTLLPLGEARAGAFICFESAFPALSRNFADAGADVLINISNDGYLGRTPVLRQHLANAVFRAVENRRTVLRVTNTGITARITPRGHVQDATASFETATRTWAVSRAQGGKTFYTRRGDLFVALCAAITILSVVSSQLSVVRALRTGAPKTSVRASVRDKTTDH